MASKSSSSTEVDVQKCPNCKKPSVLGLTVFGFKCCEACIVNIIKSQAKTITNTYKKKRQCFVCGNKETLEKRSSSKYHICFPCGKFFIDSWKNLSCTRYVCHDEKKCSIHVKGENDSCNYCRFKKCLDAGMKGVYDFKPKAKLSKLCKICCDNKNLSNHIILMCESCKNFLLDNEDIPICGHKNKCEVSIYTRNYYECCRYRKYNRELRARGNSKAKKLSAVIRKITVNTRQYFKKPHKCCLCKAESYDGQKLPDKRFLCKRCFDFYVNSIRSNDYDKFKCKYEEKCKSSRSTCDFCRFKKIIDLKRDYKLFTNNQYSKFKIDACRICGDFRNLVVHENIVMCESCKHFVQSSPKFKFCLNQGKCKLNVFTRNYCSSCRYMQFVMEKENIGKMEQKEQEEGNVCFVCGDNYNLEKYFGATFDVCLSCNLFFYGVLVRNSECEEDLKCCNNCDGYVNMQNREKCDSCRYNKCIAAGMQPHLITNDNDILKKICQVCGDENGVVLFFNKQLCKSCRLFYNLTNPELLKKCKKHGNCKITIENRNKCLECRFKQCQQTEIESDDEFKDCKLPSFQEAFLQNDKEKEEEEDLPDDFFDNVV